MTNEAKSASSRFAGWRMVGLAFLARNSAVGLTWGSYGTLLHTIEDQYDASRALTATALSAVSLTMGLLSPVVGWLTQRFALSTLMIVGAMGNAVGYALLAFAPSIEVLLAIYTLLIGPSVALLGIILPSALMTNWFVRGRGRALGFVNTPFMLFLMPLITAMLLKNWGLTVVFLAIAAVFVLIIPLMLMVVSRPEDVGQTAYGAQDQGATPGQEQPEAASTRTILTSMPFLVIVLTIGLLTAAGTMMVTHLVPLARWLGLDLTQASFLMSLYGIFAAAGSMLFGWVADRVGAPRALAIQAIVWTVPWVLLLTLAPSFALMLALVPVMGLCSGGIICLSGVITSQWLGTHNFARAIGVLYMLKIPFIFAGAPVAGLIFDKTQSYSPAIAMHSATFILVAVILLLYRPPADWGRKLVPGVARAA